MNLTSVQAEFASIKTTADKLDTICKTIQAELNLNETYTDLDTGKEIKVTDENFPSHRFSRECGTIHDQINIMLHNIQDFNMEWFHNVNQTRQKRAPFNIVGTILRSVFGTLAQEDADEYLRRFHEMEQTGNEREILMNEHTTLLKSTVQVISAMNNENIELYEKTQQQFILVNETIAVLSKDYENLWLNLELQFQLENLLMFISLSITSFHNKQKQFLEAIAFGSKISSATPIIIPPATFMEELTLIQQKITGFELPLPVDKEHIVHYYQIASTRSRIIKDQLLVSMSIPLVGLQQYDLIKLTSFPNKLPNGLHSFIVPVHEYIAIDSFRETYISLSNEELTNCHDLRDISNQAELICMQSSPIFKISSSRDDCGITLLANANKPVNCDVRVSNITNEVFIKLRKPNSWISVFPQKQVLYIRCSNLPTIEKIVEGAGIITIKQDCQIKTDEILLKAQNVYFSEIYAEVKPMISYHWDFNSTVNLINIAQTSSIKKLDSPNVISFGESNKLRELSTSIYDIQKSLDESTFVHRKFSTIPNHTYDFWMIIFLILIVVTSYAAIIIFYQHCKENVYRPSEAEMQTYRPNSQDIHNIITTETTV